jgi:hypothetical protein
MAEIVIYVLVARWGIISKLSPGVVDPVSARRTLSPAGPREYGYTRGGFALTAWKAAPACKVTLGSVNVLLVRVSVVALPTIVSAVLGKFRVIAPTEAGKLSVVIFVVPKMN